MKKQEIADLACAELEKLYPGAQCTLDYGEPYQLMMATRLAAQCTDARVNVVTKTLFKSTRHFRLLRTQTSRSLNRT